MRWLLICYSLLHLLGPKAANKAQHQFILPESD
jgi:hypothetical protein